MENTKNKLHLGKLKMLIDFCRLSSLRFNSDTNAYEVYELYTWLGSIEGYSFHTAYVVSEVQLQG